MMCACLFFEKHISVDPNLFVFTGYLHREFEGSWQRVWCKVKAKNLETYSSKTAKSPDSSIALSEATLRVPAKPMLGGSGFYVIGISLDDKILSFLAEREREWKKWVAALKVNIYKCCFLFFI